MIDLNIEAPMRCRPADGTWIVLAARLQEAGGPTDTASHDAGHRQLAGLAQPDAGDCSAHWDLLVV